MIKTVAQWLSDSQSHELVQQAGSSVDDQLIQLDKVDTGFGFVFILIPAEGEIVQPDDGPQAAISVPLVQELQLSAQAVFKIKGTWYVITDDNMSDIAVALVRMIVQNIPINK